MKNNLLALGLLLLSSACASTDSAVQPEHTAITTQQLEVYECGTIKRLHTFDGIFLASQPSPEDFEMAKMGGVKTVVNMRKVSEMGDFDEEAFIAGIDLKYISMGWNGAEELNDELFAEAREMFNSVERPALVHCSSSNRVGALWLPWRVLDNGISIEAALEEAKTIGMRTPAYETKALDYIQRNQN